MSFMFRKVMAYIKRDGSSVSILFRGSSVVVFIQVIGMLLSYAMQVIVARISGATEFGIFAYAWTWFNMLFIVASGGMNEVVLKLLPQYVIKQEWARVKGLAYTGSAVVVFIGIIIAFVIYICLSIDRWVVDYRYISVLRIVCLSAPAIGALSYFQGLGRAMNRVVISFTPRSTGLPLAVLCSILVFMCFGHMPTAYDLIIVASISAVVLCVVQFLALLKAFPKEISKIRSEEAYMEWYRLSIAMLFIAISYGILTHCDLLLVGIFLTPNEVGMYQAASRTAALVSFPLLALNALVAPMIAKLHAENRPVDLQRVVRTATQMVFIPCLMLGVGIMLFSKTLLSVFGSGFSDGQFVLQVLVVGHLIAVAAGPVSYLMSMTGNHVRCAFAWLSTIVIQISISVFLVSRLGINGVAIGTLTATVFLNVYLTILVRQRTGIRAHVFSFLNEFMPRLMRQS